MGKVELRRPGKAEIDVKKCSFRKKLEVPILYTVVMDRPFNISSWMEEVLTSPSLPRELLTINCWHHFFLRINEIIRTKI